MLHDIVSHSFHRRPLIECGFDIQALPIDSLRLLVLTCLEEHLPEHEMKLLCRCLIFLDAHWIQKWFSMELPSYHLQALSIDLAVVAGSVLH